MFAVSPTPAPEVTLTSVSEVAQTSAPNAVGRDPGSDSQVTPAPSGTSPGQSPVGSPTEDVISETDAPVDSS